MLPAVSTTLDTFKAGHNILVNVASKIFSLSLEKRSINPITFHSSTLYLISIFAIALTSVANI